MTALLHGDPCPKCGKRVDDVWGPATEKKEGTAQVRNKVIHTYRCTHCGWARVEDIVDTDEELNYLLQNLKP